MKEGESVISLLPNHLETRTQVQLTWTGVDLIDLAVKYGVQHIVFSSVEFAGQDDTGLP